MKVKELIKFVGLQCLKSIGQVCLVFLACALLGYILGGVNGIFYIAGIEWLLIILCAGIISGIYNQYYGFYLQHGFSRITIFKVMSLYAFLAGIITVVITRLLLLLNSYSTIHFLIFNDEKVDLFRDGNIVLAIVLLIFSVMGTVFFFLLLNAIRLRIGGKVFVVALITSYILFVVLLINIERNTGTLLENVFLLMSGMDIKTQTVSMVNMTISRLMFLILWAGGFYFANLRLLPKK